MERKCIVAFSVTLCIIAVVYSAFQFDGVGIIYGLSAAIFGTLCTSFLTARSYALSVFTSVLVLVVDLLYSTVLGQDALVIHGPISPDVWCVIVGLAHAIILPFLVAEVYASVAYAYHGSFNWMVVRALSVFIGLGIMIPGYVLEYIFHNVDGLSGMPVYNGYALYGFLLEIVVVFILSFAISIVMHKRRLLLNENGLRVRPRA